jgi:hypothetical protein
MEESIPPLGCEKCRTANDLMPPLEGRIWVRDKYGEITFIPCECRMRRMKVIKAMQAKLKELRAIVERNKGKARRVA